MYGYGSTATANLGKPKKFANPERAYGFAKGRPNGLESRLASSRK